MPLGFFYLVLSPPSGGPRGKRTARPGVLGGLLKDVPRATVTDNVNIVRDDVSSAPSSALRSLSATHLIETKTLGGRREECVGARLVQNETGEYLKASVSY